MLSVWAVILICAGSAILLFSGVHAAAILLKAKKSGIVRTVYTAERKKMIFELSIATIYLVFSIIDGVTAYSHRAYINDIDARGLDAKAERRGISVDELSVSEKLKPDFIDKNSEPEYYQKVSERYEDFFIDRQQQMYSQSAAYHIEMMILCLFISIVSAASALTHRAFFTKDGVYVLDKSNFSPFKVLAQINGKYLCFYEKTVPETHLFSLKATDENLETYKKLIMPEGFRVCC